MIDVLILGGLIALLFIIYDIMSTYNKRIRDIEKRRENSIKFYELRKNENKRGK